MISKLYSKSKGVCKTTFSLTKEAVQAAKEVTLLGEFNNWDHAEAVIMKKAKDGSFKATLELPVGRKYEFRYLIDNTTWANDWAADDYTYIAQYDIHNSVVVIDEVSDIPSASKPKAPSKKDDLKKIEGIGPKIAGLLNKAGIVTFSDLASAKKTTLKSVLKAAGPRFQMHDPTTWAKQSKLAAAGKWDKLKKLQDELKGGVAK